MRLMRGASDLDGRVGDACMLLQPPNPPGLTFARSCFHSLVPGCCKMRPPPVPLRPRFFFPPDAVRDGTVKLKDEIRCQPWMSP